VKLSTLLQMIGSGSILLVVGVALVALGIGYGLTEATHLPLWVCLCGLGLFISIVGFFLVDRGSEEAEEQIERELPPVIEFIRHPWFTLGASVVGGLILQRLFRGRREVVVENILPARSDEAASPSSQTPAEPASPKASEFSLSEFLGDQLRTLGTVASGAAVSMALKSLGIPSAEQLVRELLGDDTPQEQSSTDGARPSSQTNAYDQGASRGGSQAERVSSFQRSHNGANRPSEFDPLAE